MPYPISQAAATAQARITNHMNWRAVAEAVTPASARHRASSNATAAIRANKLHVAIRAIRLT
jgi:hypothetical protein